MNFVYKGMFLVTIGDVPKVRDVYERDGRFFADYWLASNPGLREVNEWQIDRFHGANKGAVSRGANVKPDCL